MNGNPENLTAVLDKLAEEVAGEQVSFNDLLGAFGQRAFGPLLLIPAVLAVAPTGAIPGMSVVTGLLITVVSVQLFFAADRPWLPRRLLRISFPRARLASAIKSLRPYAASFDRLLGPRLSFATGAVFVRVIALMSALLGLSMLPLALVPFAVAMPGTCVALLAIGLTARDGLLILLGIGLAGGLMFGATMLGAELPLPEILSRW